MPSVSPLTITNNCLPMKKSLFLFALALLPLLCSAQVTTIPAIIQKGYSGEITVIFNPNQGNGGMKGATQCYAHTGITYNGQAWQKAGTWRDGKEKYKMTKNGDGNWELKITPDIYTYYGVANTTNITQMCFVFNDGPSGSKEGKTAANGDIFVNLAEAGLMASVSLDKEGIVDKGQTINVSCNATESATMVLKMNGSEVKTGTGTAMTYSVQTSQAGDYRFELTATANGVTATASAMVCVPNTNVQQARPSGIDMGIYYDSDQTKVTLSTFAAHCTTAGSTANLTPEKYVFVVGDFNNWTVSSDYQLKQDGNYFWITLTGLTAKKEYAFQYVVVRTDGTIKYLSDMFTEKVLTQDDQYEPRTIDRTLRDYPKQADGGYVATFQTGRSAYKWSSATAQFKRPNRNNLLIYELWVYDYTAEHSFAGLLKRLDYIKDLGFNAIELMPVSEFDGNINWGYTPNHYFALDKAYGTRDQFCQLVDECHKRGLAVIIDMVFNHATGNNPMNKLYPYGDDLKYNAFFMTKEQAGAIHTDANFSEEWDHSFAPTRNMFTRCLNYWLDTYKVDGFRMDLSHGYCGRTTYDAVSNLKHYYDNAIKPHDAYFILEHWGNHADSDRPQLINYGMLCWLNTSNAYSQLAMGYMDDSNISGANQDGFVTYSESHDEERNFYKAKAYGNGLVKTDETARLNRVPATLAFNLLLNGSHMIYMYNELGYDYSINSKHGSTVISNEYRCEPKDRPDEHSWFTNTLRMEQYDRVAQVVKLRTQIKPELFAGNPQTTNVSLATSSVRTILWGTGSDAVYMVANFSPSAAQTITLPAGTWYDYLDGNGQVTSSYTLQPGMLKIFTATQVVGWQDVPAVPADSHHAKYIHNGRLVIVRDGIRYNAFGHRL